MKTINKKLCIIQYLGSSTSIASLPNRDQIEKVWRVSSSGLSFLSWDSNSSLNSLTRFVTFEFYFIASKSNSPNYVLYEDSDQLICVTSTPSDSSPTSTPGIEATQTPTLTRTPTRTPTASATATAEPTATPTESLTSPATPVPTGTPTASPTLSGTSTPTLTGTVTVTPTRTPAPTNTVTRTATVTPAPTSTPSSTNTPTPTITLTATSTPSPTNTPLPTSTPVPTNTPTLTRTLTATPTLSGTPSASPIPTGTPSASPIPTGTPTANPTSTLASPTQTPTAGTETLTASGNPGDVVEVSGSQGVTLVAFVGASFTYTPISGSSSALSMSILVGGSDPGVNQVASVTAFDRYVGRAFIFVWNGVTYNGTWVNGTVYF